MDLAGLDHVQILPERIGCPVGGLAVGFAIAGFIVEIEQAIPFELGNALLGDFFGEIVLVLGRGTLETDFAEDQAREGILVIDTGLTMKRAMEICSLSASPSSALSASMRVSNLASSALPCSPTPAASV
jgi:hypothetical protein